MSRITVAEFKDLMPAIFPFLIVVGHGGSDTSDPAAVHAARNGFLKRLMRETGETESEKALDAILSTYSKSREFTDYQAHSIALHLNLQA